MTRRVGLALAIAVLAACGGGDAPAPPEIQYGLEECGFCRMIVSEERHAGAVVDEAGTAVAFDDIGCLLNHLREQPRGAAGVVWVHDHSSGGWIAAGAAAFVRDPQGSTPMGSGLVAFAARDDAEAFARERDTAVSDWASLVAEPPSEAP